MASVSPGPIVRHLHQVVSSHAARDLTDAQLLERFVARQEPEAFAALVRRHGPMVWGVCRHVTGREHDAEDAFQAVFLVLARRGSSIRQPESVGGWLHGVACRVARKAKKLDANRRSRERRAAVSEIAPEPDRGWRELQALLDEALRELPEKYRSPFVLCCLEGRPRRDAARELGVEEGTVSSRIARARGLLQGALARRGVALAAALTAGELWRHSAQAALPGDLGRRALAVALGETSASPIVSSLAQSASPRLWAAAVALLAGVTGSLAGGYLASAPPVDSKPPAAAPRQALDAHGDPLPPGAVARLGTVRFRPGSWVSQLYFTSDGKRAVSFDTGCEVVIWEAATGRPIVRRRLGRLGEHAIG